MTSEAQNRPYTIIQRTLKLVIHKIIVFYSSSYTLLQQSNIYAPQNLFI
jgi:hypothetical protein